MNWMEPIEVIQNSITYFDYIIIGVIIFGIIISAINEIRYK